MKTGKHAGRLITLVAAAGLVLMILAGHIQGQDPASAAVVKIKGAPRLVRAQKETPLTKNMTVLFEDEIVTGARDSLVLRFATNDVLNIGPLSRVRIARPPAGGARIRVDHKQGFVWAKVEKLSASDNRFEVHTPTAVAGVRGTAFSSVVESPEKSWFCVCEGQVQVSAGGQAVVARQGQAVNTLASGGPQPPRSDMHLLEKATEATRPCFSCHQGGYNRDNQY